jgi:hypothetical protein
MAFWTDSSLIFAVQPDGINTPSSLAKGAFRAVLCDEPEVTLETEIQELDLLSGQVGAAPERLAGRRSGTLTFSMPVEGFKDGYDPTSDAIGTADILPPWFILAANAMGSDISSLAGATEADKNTNFWKGNGWLTSNTYAANGVTGKTVKLDDGTIASAGIKGGALLSTALTATATAIELGFIQESDRTSNPDSITLFDTPTNVVADDAADVYPAATGYMSADDPLSLTCWWVGQDSAFTIKLTGCFVESFSMSANAGEVPVIEFTMRFYNYENNNQQGGLVIPTAMQRTPQLVGSNSAVLKFNDATKCGVEDFSIEYTSTIREIRCHSATQGIESASRVDPRIRATFSIPYESTDVLRDSAGNVVAAGDGNHYLQSALELGSNLPIGFYVGTALGRCLAVLIPSGQIIATPTIADRDGVQAYSVEMEAAAYSGDTTYGAETAADSPLDSLFRIGIA